MLFIFKEKPYILILILVVLSLTGLTLYIKLVSLVRTYHRYFLREMVPGEIGFLGKLLESFTTFLNV